LAKRLHDADKITVNAKAYLVGLWNRFDWVFESDVRRVGESLRWSAKNLRWTIRSIAQAEERDRGLKNDGNN
jgi:hypothetical protein